MIIRPKTACTAWLLSVCNIMPSRDSTQLCHACYLLGHVTCRSRFVGWKVHAPNQRQLNTKGTECSPFHPELHLETSAFEVRHVNHVLDREGLRPDVPFDFPVACWIGICSRQGHYGKVIGFRGNCLYFSNDVEHHPSCLHLDGR